MSDINREQSSQVNSESTLPINQEFSLPVDSAPSPDSRVEGSAPTEEFQPPSEEPIEEQVLKSTPKPDLQLSTPPSAEESSDQAPASVEVPETKPIQTLVDQENKEKGDLALILAELNKNILDLKESNTRLIESNQELVRIIKEGLNNFEGVVTLTADKSVAQLRESMRDIAYQLEISNNRPQSHK